jgi:hypothetical protein
VLAGAKYQFSENFGAFAEGKMSFTHIHANLIGGGRTETDLWSPQVAVGLAVNF